VINQLSFFNTVDELNQLKENSFYRFFSLLKEKIQIPKYISAAFYMHTTGHWAETDHIHCLLSFMPSFEI